MTLGDVDLRMLRQDDVRRTFALAGPVNRSTPSGVPDPQLPDWNDEVFASSCVTHEGAIRHEPTRKAVEAA